MLTQLYHLMELKSIRPLLHIQGRVEEIESLDFLTIMDLPDDSPYFSSDNFRFVLLLEFIIFSVMSLTHVLHA